MTYKVIHFSVTTVVIFLGLWLSSCGGASEKDESTGSFDSHSIPETVTFNSHVAEIVHLNCAPCHRAGGPAPFPLIDYSEVSHRAQMIKAVTGSGFMPPWPADPTYSRFVDEKTLTQREIELIRKWAENGAPMGDPSKTPVPPQFPEGSVLGTPDLVVKFDTFHIRGDNNDHFLLVKVPFEIPHDTFIRAIEFVPGNPRLVHHMNANLVNYKPGAKKNVFSGQRYVDVEQLDNMIDGLRKLDLANDDGSYPTLTPMVSNYLPGVLPVIYPDGIGGFHMNRKGTFFINDLHYGPSAIDDIDRSYFNIFFDSVPPKRPVQEIILGTLGISEVVPKLIIPPDTIMTFRTEFTLPQSISVLTINPHMHLLGKSFLAYAVTPGNDTIPLIRIHDWDFRWQYFYTFEKMLKLERGSTVHVFATFDNTVDNPNNPNSPPATVRERDGSMKTTDEMFQFFITYLPYQPGDEKVGLGRD